LIGAVGGFALVGALGFGVWSVNGGIVAEECSPHYEPCLPVTDDLNCSDLDSQVRVVGEDLYNLDRDGNGVGCESLPPATEG